MVLRDFGLNLSSTSTTYGKQLKCIVAIEACCQPQSGAGRLGNADHEDALQWHLRTVAPGGERLPGRQVGQRAGFWLRQEAHLAA